MPTSILQIDSLSKSFGERVLFRDITFGIAEGDKIGLIAPNGAGKTTLLNIIAGREPFDSGSVTFKNDVRVAYLEQSPGFDPQLTVLQACFASGNETALIIARYEQIIASDNHEQLDEVLAQMDLLKAWDHEQRIKQVLSQLKITRVDQKVGELSGGQIKRVALANVLISEPDLIILDEPTNHLDLEMVEWLEDYLSRSSLSLLMVTHDRYFLDRVCSQILEIDQQQIFSYKGNYAYYLEKRDERLSAQTAEADRANNLMRKELDWIRRQPQARGTKAKYRIDAFHELEEKAQNRRKDESIRLATKGSYIGNKIFEAKHVTKDFGDVAITHDFNYIFSRYEKMGIVGNNGTGKSTFVKMLLGLEKPDSGSFDIGETVNFGYYSQEGLQFDEQMKVIDVVQDIAEVIDLGNGNRLTASQFLQHFLFTPDKQHNYVYKLSGGEKRRLHLCTVLIKNPNFLVLDEPTNDLDIVTLTILEDYLHSFKGCLIVISHDRYFMDKVVDHLLIFHGNAEIQDFPGNYSQYRTWKSLQSKSELEAKTSENSEKQSENRKAPVIKTKLTFKEKREFEQLEQEIESLELEKAQLTSDLSSGQLSSDLLIQASNRISELIRLIDEKTTRWLELSEFE
ncbi:ABC-F family ATP-binding cassette domain-containing protein [Seramator thermalis]|uniref:ABC-F family ATP-binding cassette domain-containing protein n=1 Tax=Seramator thermalis TaxID=2496270 RepID=UPI00101C77DE|nr:ABC-F family ATP-binding cassette domain-containing protein [Seramator thermalis]